jgi:hypothetical protein
MFTEEEARRLAAILTDTVVQPIDPRLERIEKEIPRAPTPANIIMALGPAPHAHRQGSAASDSRDRQCPALPQRGMCREPERDLLPELHDRSIAPLWLTAGPRLPSMRRPAGDGRGRETLGLAFLSF